MNESSKVGVLKGVGEKTQAMFLRLNVRTVGDLIRYYPRGFDIYEDPVSIAEAEEGKVCTVAGTVFGRIQISSGKGKQIVTMHLKDLTGTLKVIWFHMPYLRSTLSGGGLIILRGRITRKKEGTVMEHPDVFYPASRYEEKRNTMQPVYPLTSGLTNNTVIRAVRQAVSCADTSQDVLPSGLCGKYGFPPYESAVRSMHFPSDREQYQTARARFAYEEFLVFILSLRKMKEREERAENAFQILDRPETDRFLDSLPYRLTGAQLRAWEEIRRDMKGKHLMSRLVQGDVGSGKTILAVLALMLAGLNGYQGAMMAPTEVLARQHYENVSGLLKKHGIPLEAGLLTGSMSAAERRDVKKRIETGEISIVIGTHALIQEGVTFRSLALAVTDEQHRFGVRQREALASKGRMPHILVMSATPIPRTLAIILYGDLDISVIDELPENRLPIKNCVVDTGYRQKAYAFMKRQSSEGRQCYVICPMVEESETMEAENVTDYARMLSEEMGPQIQVGCLHGKMKPSEKEHIMEAFARNEIQILVSTTVVEVGIDVPNATVIMIENAERFGLAQLHQLRGRVGRGAYQSYCIFMTASGSRQTKERLSILNRSNDGFFIASEDLRLRGPGDLFGIRQSGMLDFRLADVFQDASLLQNASEDAEQILKSDPGLEFPENRGLRRETERRIREFMLETTL